MSSNETQNIGGRNKYPSNLLKHQWHYFLPDPWIWKSQQERQMKENNSVNIGTSIWEAKFGPWNDCYGWLLINLNPTMWENQDHRTLNSLLSKAGQRSGKIAPYFAPFAVHWFKTDTEWFRTVKGHCTKKLAAESWLLPLFLFLWHKAEVTTSSMLHKKEAAIPDSYLIRLELWLHWN